MYVTCLDIAGSLCFNRSDLWLNAQAPSTCGGPSCFVAHPAFINLSLGPLLRVSPLGRGGSADASLD